MDPTSGLGEGVSKRAGPLEKDHSFRAREMGSFSQSQIGSAARRSEPRLGFCLSPTQMSFTFCEVDIWWLQDQDRIMDPMYLAQQHGHLC